MNTTPRPSDDHDPDRDERPGSDECPKQPGLEGLQRIYRFSPRRATDGPSWNLEMLESPLMDRGLAYTVSDGSSAELGDEGNGCIEFELPTDRYKNVSGHRRVRIRLTVTSGRLSITAPDFYAPSSLKRTSKPPPDAAGNLRVVRLGADGDPQIDLIMAADGTVTAALRMETLLQPFNRADIVHLAEDFAVGLDLLDFAVRKERLLLPPPGDSP